MPLPIKQTVIICLLSTGLIVSNGFAQSGTNVPKLSSKDIVGIWQIGSPVVGAYLVEHFQFFKNGTFVYHYDPDDDTRNIIELKGSYLFKDNDLYFTIKSRIVRKGGSIATGAVGTDDYLFTFDNDSTKIVMERNAKQLDPVIIMAVKRNSKYFMIKINNRNYYKVSSDPAKYEDE
jgi:hypothetical protein